MFERLRRSRLAQVVVAVLAFVVVGYFSNAGSAGPCQRATDRWLSGRLAGNPTYWPGCWASSEPAEYRLPWLVAVEYEYVVGDLGGEWGTRYYLGLLGVPIPIRNIIRTQS